MSGGEEKVIFSPRGLGPDGGLGGFVPGPSGPSLFLEATQLKTAPTGRFVGHSGEKVKAQVVGVATPGRIDEQLYPS